MTPPAPTVLGHRPTQQTQRECHREILQTRRELKEDVATFAVADPNGHGTPIPYLVNPQSDMTPPTRECQTVQHAIGFTHCSDFWGDDVALQQHA